MIPCSLSQERPEISVWDTETFLHPGVSGPDQAIMRFPGSSGFHSNNSIQFAKHSWSECWGPGTCLDTQNTMFSWFLPAGSMQFGERENACTVITGRQRGVRPCGRVYACVSVRVCRGCVGSDVGSLHTSPWNMVPLSSDGEEHRLRHTGARSALPEQLIPDGKCTERLGRRLEPRPRPPCISNT